jgi:hypothetical protein
MRVWFGLLAAEAVWAQEPVPPAILRGTLVSVETGNPGSLAIRTVEDKTFRFRFDGRTYIERERRRIAAASIHPGEGVEVLSEPGPEGGVRYARIVHLFDAQDSARRYLPAWRDDYRDPLENLAPRGNLTFAGVLRSVRNGRLVLRTRLDGDQTIALRADTRFLKDGDTVTVSALAANVRVFVRAGRNLDGEIEAFQVVWGEILAPGRQ